MKSNNALCCGLQCLDEISAYTLGPDPWPQKKGLAVLNSSLIFSIFEALTKRFRRLMVVIFAFRSG
jgi:hypothetical protein